jgi:hypothetical protein
MTIGWYLLFPLAIAFLWITATNRDRPAARVVLIATLGSILIVANVTHHIAGAWKLVIPGGIETLTILCLLRWARNRTGYVQAGCLVVAWFAHLLCYLDVTIATDIVYSRYETILAIVAFAQIAAFHDTIAHNLRGLVEGWRRLVYWAHIRHRYPDTLRASIRRDRVLRSAGDGEI